MPAARRKEGFPTNISPLAPCQGCSKAEQSSTTFREEIVAFCVTGGAWTGAPDPPGGTPQTPPSTDPKKHVAPNDKGFGVLLYCLTARGQIAGLGHYSPRIPGSFTLPHRSDGTLGRGPRSEPRAPMQMVSGALKSLGFRV